MGSINHHSAPMDLSHHINSKSKARHPSPLKDIIKFMGYDGMVSLAGGEFDNLLIARGAEGLCRTSASITLPT